jgi:hypothetical protein
MTKKIIDIDLEFEDLNNGFFNESSINRRTANKTKAVDPNFKKAMRDAKTGVKRPDMVGDKNPKKSEKARLHQSKLMKGVSKSKQQIENYKQAYKLLPIIICPHCKFESKNQGNMNRYHFDNCKHK